MYRIAVPEHAGSREQADELAGTLPLALDTDTVTLDCSVVVVATPSFLDEIVKQVLVVRNAATLEVVGGPARPRELVERAARNREVHDRVRVDAPRAV